MQVSTLQADFVALKAEMVAKVTSHEDTIAAEPRYTWGTTCELDAKSTWNFQKSSAALAMSSGDTLLLTGGFQKVAGCSLLSTKNIEFQSPRQIHSGSGH